MAKYKYQRIEESLNKEDVDNYLTRFGQEGYKIIYYAELPSVSVDAVRIIMVVEQVSKSIL